MRCWEGKEPFLRVFREMGKEREAMSLVALNMSHEWL